MVKEIIVSELASGKRVVVPGFGAFIVKDGATVFVEFLKRDDGVLRTLIEERYKLDTAAATLAIENFVAGVKSSIASRGDAAIDPVGVMAMDDNGVYVLRPMTSPKPVRETVELQMPEPQPMARENIRVVTPRTAQPRPEPKPVSEPKAEQPKQTVPPKAEPQAKPQPNVVAEPATEPAEDIKYRYQRQQFGKAMTYGKPKRIDSIMVIAIVVAILSIGVMIYGMMSDSAPEIELVENPVDTTAVK